MRLDKYLKVARISKRRAVGKELADNDRVLINGRKAKPSSEVKEGDLVTIFFGQRELTIRVLKLAKGDRVLVEIIEEKVKNEDNFEESERNI